MAERYAAAGRDLSTSWLVHGVRLLQARGHLRGHPLPLPAGPDRRRRVRPHRRGRSQLLDEPGLLAPSPEGFPTSQEQAWTSHSTARTEELRDQLLAFMDEHVYPAEPAHEQAAANTGGRPLGHPRGDRGAEGGGARRQGLWNLFLPDAEFGGGPDQPRVRAAGRDHRPLPGSRPRPELRGAGHRQHGGAAQFGTDEQKERGCEPLLDGEIRSAFCDDRAGRRLVRRHQHRHPDRAGRRRVRHQRPQVVVSGAMNPNCKIFIVMGKTDPDAPSGTASSR
jgi:alkylation response protein AidB-like acyl-CoA dehydrogenase